MAIKLIATDLDGTFFNDDHITVPRRNIDAFRHAHEIGVKTAVATGRPLSLTDDILEMLPFIDYLITSNGAVTYDLKNNCVVSALLMNRAQTLKIFEILNSYALPYEIYLEGKCYICEDCFKKNGNDCVPEHFMKVLRDRLNVVESLPELLGDRQIEKINVMSLTAEQRRELEEKILATGEIYITSSVYGNMEMNHVDANKGFALRSLTDYLHIGSDSVMCFGDGENDVEMLEYASYSFAMKNGCERAKKSANYIARKNSECGVAQAIEQYVTGIKNEEY